MASKQFSLTSLILPFYLPSVLSLLGLGMVIPLLALFARHLGSTVTEASVIVGLFGFGSLLFNVPAGFFISRFGKRRVILVSTFIEATLAVVLSFARTPWFLGVFVFILGSTYTVFFVSRLSFFRTIVPAQHRGRALALLGGTNRLGHFIGPIIGGFIAYRWGYQYTFRAYAALTYVSLIFLAVWIPRVEGPRTTHQTDQSLRAIGGILRDYRRIFATAGLAMIVLQLLRSARQALVPLFGESIGLNVSEIGLLVGIMSFAEFALFFPAGIAMDRWGRKTTAVPSLILLSAGLALLPFTKSLAGMAAVVLLTGIANGIGSGINITLSTDFAPEKNPSEFIGVWRFVVDVGTAGGPFLVGALATVLSLGVSTVIIAAVGLSGAAIMGLFVPEPLKR